MEHWTERQQQSPKLPLYKSCSPVATLVTKLPFARSMAISLKASFHFTRWVGIEFSLMTFPPPFSAFTDFVFADLFNFRFITRKKGKKTSTLCWSLLLEVSRTKITWSNNQYLTLYITYKRFSYFHLNRSVPDLSVASPELPKKCLWRSSKRQMSLQGKGLSTALDYCDLQPTVEIEECCQKGRVNSTLLVLLFWNYKNIQGRSRRKAKRAFYEVKIHFKNNLKSYKKKVHQ